MTARLQESCSIGVSIRLDGSMERFGLRRAFRAKEKEVRSPNRMLSPLSPDIVCLLTQVYLHLPKKSPQKEKHET
jgi:hypothetical protein